MSNIFSIYEKALSGVKVVKSQDAFVYNPKTGKIDLPNPKYDFVGKIDMEMPNFILKMNKPNCKTAYVEDVSSLPKRLKQDLVDHFYDKNGKRNGKTKAYLIRTDGVVAKGSGRVSGSSRKQTGQSSSYGKNSARKPGTTSYKTSTSKKVTSRDNNSLW